MCMFFILVSNNMSNFNVKRIVIATFTLKKMSYGIKHNYFKIRLEDTFI